MSDNDEFVIPDKWKNPGHDDVDIEAMKKKNEDFHGLMQDPWGFCEFIMKNMVARSPLPKDAPYARPSFSDAFSNDIYGGSGDRHPVVVHHYEQWLNCIIDMGDENHPTCRKARWYLENTTHSKFIQDLDDRREAGDRYALMLRTKLKRFKSVYQPFKVKEPGLYENEFIHGRAWKVGGEAKGTVETTESILERMAANRAKARAAAV